jgi:hypothetical protein
MIRLSTRANSFNEFDPPKETKTKRTNRGGSRYFHPFKVPTKLNAGKSSLIWTQLAWNQAPGRSASMLSKTASRGRHTPKFRSTLYTKLWNACRKSHKIYKEAPNPALRETRGFIYKHIQKPFLFRWADFVGAFLEAPRRPEKHVLSFFCPKPLSKSLATSTTARSTHSSAFMVKIYVNRGIRSKQDQRRGYQIWTTSPCNSGAE